MVYSCDTESVREDQMGIRIWQGKSENAKSSVISCPECGSEDVSLVHSKDVTVQVGGIAGQPVVEVSGPDTQCKFICNNPRCPKKPSYSFNKHFRAATRIEEF